ncbi:hypothetical protein RAS1_30830 [Phycisphaerae bacterium RAS1]|nr:hypothetical protein RAS1_30830 [Phycisphaerae bacterium RAS1]
MARVLASVRAAFFLIVATWCVAEPIWIDNYRCVFQQACGAVSQSCWMPPGHPWGSSTCTYCTDDRIQDLCEKWETSSCNYIGTNQKCGARMSGNCLPGTSGSNNIGTCTGGSQTGTNCTVPMC